MCSLEIREFFCKDSFLDAFVRKFGYFSAVGANQVLVDVVVAGLFVLSGLVPELVFDNQFAFQQQLQCVVNRGQADAEVVLHVVEQGFRIEMRAIGINPLQDGIAFHGFAATVRFQIFGKNLLGKAVCVFFLHLHLF